MHIGHEEIGDESHKTPDEEGNVLKREQQNFNIQGLFPEHQFLRKLSSPKMINKPPCAHHDHQ